MNLKDLQEDKVFQDYIEEKELKPKTIENYSYFMKNYCDSTGLTPTLLLEQALIEEENRVPLFKTKLKQHLKDFDSFLMEKGYSKQHQISAMTTVRNFYSYHDVRLPHSKPNRTPKTHETINDIPTKEEIKQVLGYCNNKYRAIILLMTSSSMGSAEVRSLKVQDFLNSLSEYFNSPLKLPLDIEQIRQKMQRTLLVPTFNIVRIKTNMPYFTFATPEAVNAILDMIESYNEDHLIENTNEPLFRNKNSKKNGKRYKEITTNSFTTYFRRLNASCGFGMVNTTTKFHSHTLRKFFASTLIAKDIKQWSIDSMLGHSVKNRTTGAYFKPDPKHIRNDYIKIINELTILEQVDVKHLETEEYKELQALKIAERERESENIKLKESLEKQKEQHRAEMEELKAQINQSQTKTDEFQKTIMDMLQSGEISPSEIDFKTGNEKMSYLKKRFPNKKIN